MGVHNLWKILESVKDPLKLEHLKGQTLAVDLSIWICDAQGVKQMQGVVAKPHLRNLFFRVSHLLQMGVSMIFVVDGEAPELKWETIISRQQARLGHFGAKVSKPTRKPGRSHFKRLINECCQMLEHLGVPYVQSVGEAEAYCAVLNKLGFADAVVTQDGDAFLYGATRIYRNFTISGKEAQIESYSIEDVSVKLHLNRDKLVALGLLLGCDFVPKGVPGIGKETAMKFMTTYRDSKSILERFRDWRLRPTCMSDSPIESKLKAKALEVKDFPFEKVINEFMVVKDKPPRKSLLWKKPNIERLYIFNEKLEWPMSYTNEKIVPLLTLHDMRSIKKTPQHKPEPRPKCIVKARVRQFVPSFEVQWKRLECDRDAENTTDFYITFEERDLFAHCYPDVVAQFEETAKKPGTKKKRTSKKLASVSSATDDNINSDDVVDSLRMSDLRIENQDFLKNSEQDFGVRGTGMQGDCLGSRVQTHPAFTTQGLQSMSERGDVLLPKDSKLNELSSNASSVTKPSDFDSKCTPGDGACSRRKPCGLLSALSNETVASDNDDDDEPADLITRLRRMRLTGSDMAQKTRTALKSQTKENQIPSLPSKLLTPLEQKCGEEISEHAVRIPNGGLGMESSVSVSKDWQVDKRFQNSVGNESRLSDYVNDASYKSISDSILMREGVKFDGPCDEISNGENKLSFAVRQSPKEDIPGTAMDSFHCNFELVGNDSMRNSSVVNKSAGIFTSVQDSMLVQALDWLDEFGHPAPVERSGPVIQEDRDNSCLDTSSENHGEDHEDQGFAVIDSKSEEVLPPSNLTNTTMSSVMIEEVSFRLETIPIGVKNFDKLNTTIPGIASNRNGPSNECDFELNPDSENHPWIKSKPQSPDVMERSLRTPSKSENDCPIEKDEMILNTNMTSASRQERLSSCVAIHVKPEPCSPKDMTSSVSYLHSLKENHSRTEKSRVIKTEHLLSNTCNQAGLGLDNSATDRRRVVPIKQECNAVSASKSPPNFGVSHSSLISVKREAFGVTKSLTSSPEKSETTDISITCSLESIEVKREALNSCRSSSKVSLSLRTEASVISNSSSASILVERGSSGGIDQSSLESIPVKKEPNNINISSSESNSVTPESSSINQSSSQTILIKKEASCNQSSPGSAPVKKKPSAMDQSSLESIKVKLEDIGINQSSSGSIQVNMEASGINNISSGSNCAKGDDSGISNPCIGSISVKKEVSSLQSSSSEYTGNPVETELPDTNSLTGGRYVMSNHPCVPNAAIKTEPSSPKLGTSDLNNCFELENLKKCAEEGIVKAEPDSIARSVLQCVHQNDLCPRIEVKREPSCLKQDCSSSKGNDICNIIQRECQASPNSVDGLVFGAKLLCDGGKNEKRVVFVKSEPLTPKGSGKLDDNLGTQMLEKNHTVGEDVACDNHYACNRLSEDNVENDGMRLKPNASTSETGSCRSHEQNHSSLNHSSGTCDAILHDGPALGGSLDDVKCDAVKSLISSTSPVVQPVLDHQQSSCDFSNGEHNFDSSQIEADDLGNGNSSKDQDAGCNSSQLLFSSCVEKHNVSNEKCPEGVLLFDDTVVSCGPGCDGDLLLDDLEKPNDVEAIGLSESHMNILTSAPTNCHLPDVAAGDIGVETRKAAKKKSKKGKKKQGGKKKCKVNLDSILDHLANTTTHPAALSVHFGNETLELLRMVATPPPQGNPRKSCDLLSDSQLDALLGQLGTPAGTPTKTSHFRRTKLGTPCNVIRMQHSTSSNTTEINDSVPCGAMPLCGSCSFNATPHPTTECDVSSEGACSDPVLDTFLPDLASEALIPQNGRPVYDRSEIDLELSALLKKIGTPRPDHATRGALTPQNGHLHHDRCELDAELSALLKDIGTPRHALAEKENSTPGLLGRTPIRDVNCSLLTQLIASMPSGKKKPPAKKGRKKKKTKASTQPVQEV